MIHLSGALLRSSMVGYKLNDVLLLLITL